MMQFISYHCLSQSLETTPELKATTEISVGVNYTFFRSEFKTPLPGFALAIQENVPIGNHFHFSPVLGYNLIRYHYDNFSFQKYTSFKDIVFNISTLSLNLDFGFHTNGKVEFLIGSGPFAEILIKPKARGYLGSSESRTTENVNLEDNNYGVRAFVGVQLNREKFFITIKPLFSLSLKDTGNYMSEMNLTHYRLSVGIGF